MTGKLRVEFTKEELAHWSLSKVSNATAIATGKRDLLVQPPALPLNYGELVCQGDWDAPLPRVLQIGIPTKRYQAGVANYFPPPSAADNPAALGIGDQSFDCGLIDGAGNTWESRSFGVGGKCMACVLEYGVGAASNVVFFDWLQGVYQLPPCTFARVSALPWGSGYTAPVTLRLAATIAPGEAQGAHVPTATGHRWVTGGATATLFPPNGARAMDVAQFDAQTAVVTVTGAVNAKRNYPALSQYPGWSPVEVMAAVGAVSVSSDVDALLSLRWYLQL